MSKKLSKDQIESDILVTGYARTLNYIQDNQNTLIIGFIVLLFISGSLVGLYYYNQSQERIAHAIMMFPEQYFNNSDYERALNGDPATFTPGFITIIQEYGSTDAANIARYYVAVSELRLGNNESANNYISRFKPPKGIMGVGPISMHGVILENLGQYNEAVATYKKAARWDDNASTTPINLTRAAQSAYLANNYSLAESLSREVIEKFGNSPSAINAQKILGMLAAAS